MTSFPALIDTNLLRTQGDNGVAVSSTGEIEVPFFMGKKCSKLEKSYG